MADSWEDIDKQPKKATGGLNPAASSFSFNPQVASWAPPAAAAGVFRRRMPHASRDFECAIMWLQNNRGVQDKITRTKQKVHRFFWRCHRCRPCCPLLCKGIG